MKEREKKDREKKPKLVCFKITDTITGIVYARFRF